MGTSKLQQYNGALRFLGERRLLSLTEEGKSRRELDSAWDESIAFMLEQGFWNFAIRSSELLPDEDQEPLFGYSNSFERPSDYVQLVAISDVGFFDTDTNAYEGEATHWFSDADKLYVRYVSNDAAYGLNLGRWPATFCTAHQAYLAFLTGPSINSDRADKGDNFSLHEKWVSLAKVKDAIEQKVTFKPAGRVVRARFGRRMGGER